MLKSVVTHDTSQDVLHFEWVITDFGDWIQSLETFDTKVEKTSTLTVDAGEGKKKSTVSVALRLITDGRFDPWLALAFRTDLYERANVRVHVDDKLCFPSKWLKRYEFNNVMGDAQIAELSKQSSTKKTTLSVYLALRSSTTEPAGPLSCTRCPEITKALRAHDAIVAENARLREEIQHLRGWLGTFIKQSEKETM